MYTRPVGIGVSLVTVVLISYWMSTVSGGSGIRWMSAVSGLNLQKQKSLVREVKACVDQLWL